jgi:hypothetical protein
MKSTVSMPKFSPAEVTITLESQAELDRFITIIGNVTAPGNDICSLYDKLSKAGGVCTPRVINISRFGSPD